MINRSLEDRVKRLEERQTEIVRILQALQRIRKKDKDPMDITALPDSDEHEIENGLRRLGFF